MAGAIAEILSKPGKPVSFSISRICQSEAPAMLTAFRLAYAGLSGHLGEISRAVEMKEDEAVLLREELAEIIERDNRRQFLPDRVHFVRTPPPIRRQRSRE